MIKTITFIFMSLILMNCAAVAKEVQPISDESAQYTQNEDFNFDDNSYYISDEQLEDAKNIDKIEDDNSSFWTKIINSSHFSSDTATRTWIPIRKVK